ncbi:MAG: hypothetical protein EOP87_10105 [Verrucomicrobiaceae bacterium]|nr:MAG: hypothetical protein EOP87_10105 [Verrucomicrobiaceae bacterium]
MTSRSFHRSRLFWLGLPGLIFLAWVWLGTRPHFFWMQKGTPAAIVLLGTDSGSYRIAWTRRLSPQIHFTVTGIRSRSSTQDPAPLFPPAFSHLTDESPGIRRSSEVRIAHWLAVAIYLALWLTTCALWQHRKHRCHLLESGSPS